MIHAQMRTPPGQGAALISGTLGATGPEHHTLEAIVVQALAPVLAAHWFRPLEIADAVDAYLDDVQ